MTHRHGLRLDRRAGVGARQLRAFSNRVQLGWQPVGSLDSEAEGVLKVSLAGTLAVADVTVRETGEVVTFVSMYDAGKGRFPLGRGSTPRLQFIDSSLTYQHSVGRPTRSQDCGGWRLEHLARVRRGGQSLLAGTVCNRFLTNGGSPPGLRRPSRTGRRVSSRALASGATSGKPERPYLPYRSGSARDRDTAIGLRLRL